MKMLSGYLITTKRNTAIASHKANFLSKLEFGYDMILFTL